MKWQSFHSYDPPPDVNKTPTHRPELPPRPTARPNLALRRRLRKIQGPNLVKSPSPKNAEFET